MQREEIDVTILRDGRVEYTIKGVKGGACDSISALLETLGKVVSAERTGEYYEQGSDASISVNRP